VIAADIHIKGDVKGKSNVELRGTVEGSFELEGNFVIREEGKLLGDISATNVVIEGEVQGQVTARQKLELGPSSRTQGDVQAGAVSISEGAFFHGNVQMTGNGSRSRGASREHEPSAVEEREPAYGEHAAAGVIVQ
jgi:cytoskeletal protein CcmA (bactofilin family)